MEKSYDVLKNAMARVGVKAVAMELGLSQPLIYKWCTAPEDSDSSGKITTGATNPLDRVARLMAVTGDPEIVNWLCHQEGGFFVENIPADKLYYYNKVSKTIQKLIKEFSETLSVISQSYDDDKKIDEIEANHIRKEWEDLKRVGESFVLACEQGKFT